MSKVILIKDKTQLDQIISENENVVVDYFAEWCGPCKMLLPVLDAVSTEVNNVTICKVNVDDNSELKKLVLEVYQLLCIIRTVTMLQQKWGI